MPGTYQLRVQGTGSATGSYSFRLSELTSATAITPGTPVSATLNPGTATNLYKFDVSAGDRVYFDQQSLSAGTVYSRLIDPFGHQVWFNSSGDVDTQELPFTGTYTLLVEGYIFNSSTPITSASTSRR